MTILYIASKILTFPGAYLRGFWEQLTCKLLGLPVEAPGYLRLDEACGHVEHGLSQKGFASYLMATGPGFMNLMTGFPIFLMGYISLEFLGIRYSDGPALFIINVIMTYIGISLMCNIFPLVEDAMNLFDVAYSQKKMNIIGRILFAIPSAITYVGAYLEKYGITVLLWIVFVVFSFVS